MLSDISLLIAIAAKAAIQDRRENKGFRNPSALSGVTRVKEKRPP